MNGLSSSTAPVSGLLISKETGSHGRTAYLQPRPVRLQTGTVFNGDNAFFTDFVHRSAISLPTVSSELAEMVPT